MKDKFKIQEEQYSFPYHYLVDLGKYNNTKSLKWGLEYYAYMRHTADYIKDLKFNNLLDIGCGDGKLINYLAAVKPENRFVGVDMSEPAINLAKGLNYELKNTEFICDDAKNITEKFDVVVLNEVLEHIPDKAMNDFVASALLKLRKGGVLVVTVPSANTPVQKKHFRHYTPELLQSQFNNMEAVTKGFIFKNNFISKIFMALTGRQPFFKGVELAIGKSLIFKASESNCKHIFMVFKDK